MSAFTARAGEPELLIQFVPGSHIEAVTEKLKAAINTHNFTFVRQQAIDSRMVPPDWEAASIRIVYFCNFDKMDNALRQDKRAAQLMPCRITLIEDSRGVNLIAVNPAWVSEQWNAPESHEKCLNLKHDYVAILEETAL
ncbi:MAG: DUF302 domain-containing protein [Thiobacillaceae bacterium]